MKTTREQIIFEIQSIWGNLKVAQDVDHPGHIYIPRAEYWSPKRKNIEKFLIYTHANRLKKFLDPIFSCANFALALDASADEYLYQLVALKEVRIDEALRWSIGQIWLHGHAQNICRTSDQGWLIIEPQNDAITKANPGLDPMMVML